jgi:nitrogen fixation NifU-like protein
MSQYTATVMEHFLNPRNVGELDSPDGVGQAGNPADGDTVTMQVSVGDDGVVTDIRMRVFGCAAAIASASITTELARGLTVREAQALTRDRVADALGGLPPQKMECSNIGPDALHAAITEYLAGGGPDV